MLPIVQLSQPTRDVPGSTPPQVIEERILSDFEVSYALWGRALVLIDVQANLVFDILQMPCLKERIPASSISSGIAGATATSSGRKARRERRPHQIDRTVTRQES